ncbi:uncharacterized protein LOC130284344 [Hyla sarda]|uniref:uncharacterized protein LOC130284344 n=1 Tax=Hyla sarda TaxID=327740 RepID=UPI0024C35EBD|nr:uncharacterized protein LOC130284344 [Hyla sarda]
MDSQAMIDYIRSFRLDSCRHGNQGYSRVLLQLFGYTGHGKSSFINSCKYVLDDGPYKVYAKVARSDNKPGTMIRNSYELTDTVTLVDNRGCVKMTKYEIGVIYAQLGNFQPLDNKVEWQENYMDMVETLLNSERRDQSSDFIVPVLIYSADCSLTNYNDIKEILIAARDITGVFPTLVLTHELSQHLQEVIESFRQMGVKNMFSLENYTKEDSMKTRGKHETILKCLHEIIKDVEFRMLEERDVIGENIERKRILLKFAYDRETEKQQKEMEKQREKERRICAVL